MEKTKIGGIFTNSRLLKIPFFQRSYVWTEDNWSRFIDDMEHVVQNDKDYFLGTYIMKQQPTPSNSRISDIRTVIDGQQRFTTILLFFLVLYQNNNNYEGFKRDFFNRTNNICLLHNHNDIEIFEAIMNDTMTQDVCNKYADSQILKAYQYFQSETKHFTEYDIDILLNRLYFVGIDVQQDENEQQIFDTINSLGVRLTTAELLKNYLFTSEDDIELYNSTWLRCFEKDTETKNFWDASITSGSKVRSNIDILLYSYLNIKYDKEFTIETLFENFKIYLTNTTYQKSIS